MSSSPSAAVLAFLTEVSTASSDRGRFDGTTADVPLRACSPVAAVVSPFVSGAGVFFGLVGMEMLSEVPLMGLSSSSSVLFRGQQSDSSNEVTVTYASWIARTTLTNGSSSSSSVTVKKESGFIPVQYCFSIIESVGLGLCRHTQVGQLLVEVVCLVGIVQNADVVADGDLLVAVTQF